MVSYICAKLRQRTLNRIITMMEGGVCGGEPEIVSTTSTLLHYWKMGMHLAALDRRGVKKHSFVVRQRPQQQRILAGHVSQIL
jgi:hypothetical protein